MSCLGMVNLETLNNSLNDNSGLDFYGMYCWLENYIHQTVASRNNEFNFIDVAANLACEDYCFKYDEVNLTNVFDILPR